MWAMHGKDTERNTAMESSEGVLGAFLKSTVDMIYMRLWAQKKKKKGAW